jgi:tryptophan-rich sensory protein
MRSVVISLIATLQLVDFAVGYQPSRSRIFSQYNAVGVIGKGDSLSPAIKNLVPLTAEQKKWNPHMSVSSSTRSGRTPDFLAVLNYIAATSVQLTLVATFLHFFQLALINKVKTLVITIPAAISSALPAKFVAEVPAKIVTVLPSAMVGVFMLFMSLKSRVFSPLDNSRPSASKDDPVFKDRLRPSWTPPPLAFPIIWSTIALLRTFSTVLIFRSTGTLLCKPIFALMAHLSIGDTWNTINNVEKRLGTAVLGVAFVWASAVYATYLYYKTLPLAGKILAPSCVWLTVASLLVYSIWRMNSIYLNERSSLFPSKQEGPRSSWRLPFLSLKK